MNWEPDELPGGTSTLTTCPFGIVTVKTWPETTPGGTVIVMVDGAPTGWGTGCGGGDGVDNDLFYEDKTMMLFGDGKKMMTELVSSMKEL